MHMLVILSTQLMDVAVSMICNNRKVYKIKKYEV